jgi:serine/threonine-protein kinase
MAGLIGQTLGRYRIVELIGHGRTATVYKAYQAALERYVAIKVIHAQAAAGDEQFHARFEREVRAVAALRHPHIAQIIDLGSAGGAPYIVMDYLPGITLKARLDELALRGARMRLREACRIGAAVADGLACAHQKGIVHGDVRPANVMLTSEGHIVLTDFGMVSLVGAPQATAAGVMIGDPAYTAPEQCRDEPGDPRSDVYALGVMLYEMVTGRLPFGADTPRALREKHMHDLAPPPSQINPSVPAALERILLKAMSKNPADRYQQAADMAGELADALTRPPRPPRRVFVDVVDTTTGSLSGGGSYLEFDEDESQENDL